MNIYVGNLPYKFSEDDLKEKFGAFGEVSTASIITDKATGRSKGFGFVEMPDNAQAQEAINALANWEAMGRQIKVNEAKPREEKSFRDRKPRARV